MVTPAPGLRRGATYLALLFAIAATAGALAAAGNVWSNAQQRERERELLWIGEQFRHALRSYVQAGDGRLPMQLDDLLEDPRTPARVRHLRRIYADPMTRTADWVVLRDARGGIVGLHSRSKAAPLKRAGFAPVFARFSEAATYADWHFRLGGEAATDRLRRGLGAALAASAPSAGSPPASSPAAAWHTAPTAGPTSGSASRPPATATSTAGPQPPPPSPEDAEDNDDTDDTDADTPPAPRPKPEAAGAGPRRLRP